MADVVSTHPNPSGDFAPVSDRWDGIGARVRVTDDNGVHDAYQLPDGRIVNKALRTPSAARIAADAAKATAEAAETARQLLIAQRLGERADAHAGQKAAVITTIAQAQAHIRQMHATLEALCRLQRGDVLSDVTP